LCIDAVVVEAVPNPARKPAWMASAAYSPTDVVLERLAHTDPDLVPDDL
jgi:hypothetical protein